MEKVSSTVLMGVQSQLSDGRMSKNDDVIVQSSQDFATLVAQLMCCMCRKLTSTISVEAWDDMHAGHC